MNFLRRFKPTHFLWFAVILIIAKIGEVYITSKVAQGNSYAVQHIFQYGKTNAYPRNIEYLILYGSGFQSSGTWSCGDYYYLALQGADVTFLKARILQAKQAAPFSMWELAEGFGTSFRQTCREAISEYAKSLQSSAQPGEH